MTADWLFVASIVFLGVSLGVLAYAVRQAHTRRADTTADGDGAVTADTVECPDCGTTNEQGYRYCQECLAELPASVSYVPDSIGTDDRQIP